MVTAALTIGALVLDELITSVIEPAGLPIWEEGRPVVRVLVVVGQAIVAGGRESRDLSH